ncbi:MAG: APC family permease [Candidatus Njordarchaeum guaymaensis]
MSDSAFEDKKDKRSIGFVTALAFGIGGMIGGGIFALSGEVARMVGSGAILVFLLAALSAIVSGLVYSEFSTIITSSGGGYSFVQEVFPEIFGFVAGWWFLLAYTFAGSFYAGIFGKYLEIITGIHYLFFSIILVISFCLINYLGAKESGLSELLLVLIKLSIIFMFILLGFSQVGFNLNWEELLHVAPMEVIFLTSATFVAFQGFDVIATLGQDLKNPEKNISRAIVYSLISVTVIYIIVVILECSAIKLGLVPGDAQSEYIILYVMGNFAGSWGELILIFAAVVSAMSAYNATIYAGSRIGYTMGENHALPRIFRLYHQKFNTPYASIILSGGISLGILIILTLFLSPEMITIALGQLSGLAFAFSFAMVNLSLIIHRSLFPNIDRLFKVPFYPILPIYGVLTAFLFGLITALENIILFLIFILLSIAGVGYYLFFMKEVRSYHQFINILTGDFNRAKEAISLRKILNEIKRKE